MKSLLFAGIGVAIGFVLAHKVSRTPAGAHVFAQLDARTKDFAAAFADGYRARDAELRTDIDV